MIQKYFSDDLEKYVANLDHEGEQMTNFSRIKECNNFFKTPFFYFAGKSLIFVTNSIPRPVISNIINLVEIEKVLDQQNSLLPTHIIINHP